MKSNAPASDSLIGQVRREHGSTLAHYVRMARLLGEMFEPVLETVVHDLRNPEASIVAIFNEHITGREVGDPATDLGRKLMEGDFPDKVVGYENESPTGHRLKSSSLAIRDDEGVLIGVLGLNMDVSYFEKFGNFIERFISSHQSEYTQSGENFRGPATGGRTTPREDIRNAVQDYITSRSWNARALTHGEKRQIVAHLYDQGYFKVRGAVTSIAEELGLTRASIYNYKNDHIEKRDGSAA